MNDKLAFRFTPQAVFGIAVILIGIVLLLDNLGFICADDILLYWPVLLILFGLVKVFQRSGAPGRGFGVLVLLLGVLLLLDNLWIIDFSIWDYWPLILILLGLSLVRGGYRRRRGVAPGGTEDASSFINGFALLGGQAISSKSNDFKGGSLTAILGGCEVDLRDASIRSGEAIIDCFAMWGGIEIKVPEDWTVSLHGVPILGGFGDKTRRAQSAGAQKQLVIKGYAIMGGVEVKN